MTKDSLLRSDLHSKLPLIYFMLAISIMHICNVMAFKIITLFGYQFAFTGIFFPFSFLLLTVLNESYGHVETERHIFYILVSQSLLISIISLVVRFDVTNNVFTSGLYYDLYKNLYKLLLSSNLAVGLSYYFTSFLNSKLKCWFLGKSWWIRFIASNGLGKAILVLSTYPINFYGILSWHQILHVCINTWIFKMSIALLLLAAAQPLIKMNRKLDNADIYDFGILYNPIKMYKSGNYGENHFSKINA